MKTKTMLLLLVSLCMTKAIASGPGFGPLPLNKDPNCVTSLHDPFEPRTRMQKGPDKGECINATLRRSATLLSDEAAARYFAPSEDKIVVANVSHKGQFWVAQIPINKISKMVLQSEHFPMLERPVEINIDHTQIRFDFSRPIRLVTQDLKSTRKTATLKHILFSVENVGPRGEVFDFIQGMKGHFNMAYRLVSLEDKYNWMIIKNKNIVDQKEFLLNSDQAADLLLEGIKRGTKYGSSRSYHSLKRNCASELVNIFNSLFGTSEFKMTSFYSNRLEENLISIGLLSSEQMLTFNEEYRHLMLQ